MLTKNILQIAVGKQLWIDLVDGRSVFAYLKNIDGKMNLEISDGLVINVDGTQSELKVAMLRGNAVKMFRFTDQIVADVNDSIISHLNSKIKQTTGTNPPKKDKYKHDSQKKKNFKNSPNNKA